MPVLKRSSDFGVGQAVMIFDGWGDMFGMGIVTLLAGPYSLKVITANNVEYLVSSTKVEPLS